MVRRDDLGESRRVVSWRETEIASRQAHARLAGAVEAILREHNRGAWTLPAFVVDRLNERMVEVNATDAAHTKALWEPEDLRGEDASAIDAARGAK